MCSISFRTQRRIFSTMTLSTNLTTSLGPQVAWLRPMICLQRRLTQLHPSLSNSTAINQTPPQQVQNTSARNKQAIQSRRLTYTMQCTKSRTVQRSALQIIKRFLTRLILSAWWTTNRASIQPAKSRTSLILSWLIKRKGQAPPSWIASPWPRRNCKRSWRPSWRRLKSLILWSLELQPLGHKLKTFRMSLAIGEIPQRDRT